VVQQWAEEGSKWSGVMSLVGQDKEEVG